MKRNVNFFMTVTALLLLSAVILTGCIYVIAADNGATKPYDPEQRQETSDGGVTQPGEKNPGNSIVEDAPITQGSLQAKFESMYEISEDGKTITVISEDYLNNYWRSNYEKEVIHSLTTEEVYFIIQDSIRIYEEYDEVVLTGFASVSSMMQVAERFPFVKDEVIKTQPDVTPYYEWDDTEAIYEIILYRLKALSSPKAFFTGEEAIRFVGAKPGIDSTMLPWTTFYIPDYSENTDRSTILKAIGYAVIPNIDYDVDVISDLFSFCNKNGAYINFESKTNAQSTKVYPTVELDNKTKPYFSIKLPELNNAVLEHKQDYKLYLDGELLVGRMAEDFANLCLYDITGDGVPELCFVMATGSGMLDYNIVIMDPLTKECIFSLSDRCGHDYKLFFRDGLLCVLERKYMSIEFTRTGVLTYDGSKISVSWDAEINYPYDLPTGIPFDPNFKIESFDPAPDPQPPVNNEKDPDEDDERWAYLKYDSNNNYCTLMSPDGNCVLEGSYAKEDDKLVFMFKTVEGVYTYCFQYRGGVVYTYSNDLSSPAPGYRFGDGMEYYLTVFDDGICFLEAEAQAPTDVHAEEFERYYPDELYNIYVLSHLVSWEDILAGEVEQKENGSFYNEQLPPFYLMIRHFDISKEAFLSVADQLGKEQIDWLFSGADEKAIMENLKAEWAVYYDGRLYNVYELAELDKDLVIELRENGVFDELIAYMDSLGVESEALTFIKDAGR